MEPSPQLLEPSPKVAEEKKKKKRGGRVRRLAGKVFKKKIPQEELLEQRQEKFFFVHFSALEEGVDPVAKQILESYEWLGDSTIRALKGARSGGAPVELGEGAFGKAWKVTHKGADYAMKISTQSLDFVPFGVGEGMIGAYLTAPRLDLDRQRDLAVPAYRVEDPNKPDFDPFVHVADYYGVLVLQADGVAKSLEALFGAKNAEWKPIVEHLKAEEKEAKKTLDPMGSYVLIQILEYFDGGTLRKWARKTAMSSDPGSKKPDWGPGWDRRHASMMHYMKMMFFQISMTVVSLRRIGFTHGDLHDLNLLIRMVRRKDAMAIYSRASNAYTLLDSSEKTMPPFAGSDEELFPVPAMADFGFSVIGTFSAAAGKSTIAHQAHDLHKMSVWLLRLVALAAHPPMDTLALEKLSDEDFWSRGILSLYAKAFHDLYTFCAALRNFVIEPSEAQRLFWGFGSSPDDPLLKEYVVYVRYLDLYIGNLKYYSDLWIPEDERSATFPGPSADFTLGRLILQSDDHAKRMANNKAVMLMPFYSNRYNPGTYAFHDGTNWMLATAVYSRQEAAVLKNVVAPSGMRDFGEEVLPALAKKYHLVQPKFVEGDEEFWRSQPAPSKARGKATGLPRKKVESTRRPLF